MLKIFATFFCTLFVTFNLLTGNAWATGAFSQTCANINVKGPVLEANCRKINGAFNNTAIDLNYHIANLNGNLDWRGDNFYQTCNNVGLAGRNRLRAECEKADGYTMQGSYIDLDQHIANIDGTLRFEP